MKLIITDTNIFFDIISIGALPEFFSLDYEICTTVFVIKEITRSDQREAIEVFTRAKDLNVIEFNSDEIGEKSLLTNLSCGNACNWIVRFLPGIKN